MVWLMGVGLALALAMIVGLLGIVLLQGLASFWPRPMDLVTLSPGSAASASGGERILGVPIRTEAYDPSPEEASRIQQRAADGTLPQGSLASDGRPKRRLYRIGNRELGRDPFLWVPLHEIQSLERPSDAVLLERRDWGVWSGIPAAVVEASERTLAAGEPRPAAEGVSDGVRVTREVIEQPDGTAIVREQEWRVTGSHAAIAEIRRLAPEASARRAQVEHLRRIEVGRINGEIDRERLRVRRAELALGDAATRGPGPGVLAWSALTLAAIMCAAGARRAFTRVSRCTGARAAAWAALASFLIVASGAGLLGSWFERPFGRQASPERLERIRTDAAARIERAGQEYARVRARIAELEAEDERWRAVVVEPTTGRFAPARQSEPSNPLPISGIVRMVTPNPLSFGEKLGVFASRWREFLLGDPRFSNTEGGIFPVIVGTVLLTLLLSVAVVPLGVIAALYLREYARQGPITSMIRIAVNNLAGVPSIVYGVFGLGFFCYTVGAYVDRGPAPSDVLDRAAWWGAVVMLAASSAAAVWLQTLGRPAPGTPPARRHRVVRGLGGGLWIVCTLILGYVLISTPYFKGLYRESAPSPTFGARGLLWASLTLALLTLPVVIVSAEEALSAVPRTSREGSYGCGASKWQTIRRIVLPGAMPGIMTGMILAMARGAGEVAPLMLVGAVKLAEPPIDGEFPFLHPSRSFMHLGFHIYDLGFQSPDSNAARPMVWTTTLVLVVIVAGLNAAAIGIRSGLRSRLKSATF